MERTVVALVLVWLAAGAAAAAEYDPRFDHNLDGVINHRDLCQFMAHWHAESGLAEGEVLIPIPGLPAEAKPLVMVLIPAGSFEMGSPATERSRDGDEEPVHAVTIGYEFHMSKYEITQAQWQALMGSLPAVDNGAGDDYPVYNVIWNECQAFVEALNGLGFGTFRLPSEAEWEYACRAGTATRFSFGDSLGCADDCSNCEAGTLAGNRTDYMWYCANNTSRDTKPVGLKQPNGFGLYDMHGNVWEWIQDWHHPTYEGAPTDGSAWVIPAAYERVTRGGAHANTARYCRSASRSSAWPATRLDDVGFRVAASIQPPSP